MDYYLIIPARYKSSRFPGKPLVDICGKSMLERTYGQCISVCDQKKVFVATDDERIVEHCNLKEMNSIFTPADCLTGTDRVAYCIDRLESDLYINVQGDEPIFNPCDLKNLIDKALQNKEVIYNGYAEIKSEDQYRNRAIPKVVFDNDNNLIYMSRAPIPNNKENKFLKSWRQICAYSFPRNALIDFSNRKQKTRLEQIEDLEILRFLEMGYKVKMLEMSNDSIAVDHPEDVKKVIAKLSKNEKS